MSSFDGHDVLDVSSKQIPDEVNEHIARNTLLYPFAKAFLEKFPQYRDIIDTYENAVESIPNILSKDQIIDEYINIDDSTVARFKFWIDNVRIYSPNSLEAVKSPCYMPTPNQALAERKPYSCTVIGDVNYSYVIKHRKKQNTIGIDVEETTSSNEASNEYKSKIENAYIVNVPIPIGCKWCTLRQYDPVTLIKTGEEMKSMYGFFIIEGFLRYIIPVYNKPFNKPIVVKNNFDEQMARSEALYTKGYEYESSYYMVGAMVVPKSAHTGRGGASVSPPDFGFSLQFNHKTMYSENNVNQPASKSKKLINFVPIKFLFCAFGCLTDEEMIHYICPEMNDFGLINAISYACLQGYKHREAVQNANIKIKANSNYIIYEEPMTEMLAKYIIGVAILSDKTKESLLQKSNKNENIYKLKIAQLVTEIFNECFMPAIGDPDTGSKVDRNTAICVELGIVIKKLYLIGYGLEVSQDKAALTNRRIRNGQQLSREFKAFEGRRNRNDILPYVKNVFAECKEPNQINQVLANIMQERSKHISSEQTKSLINSFKDASVEQSKLKTDIIEPKNQAFVSNHLREIVITSSTKQTGAKVSWEHRLVHQSEMFFICPTQTPEGGGQTGRYKTPTLYTYITVATKGLNVIKLVQSDPHYHGTIKNYPHPEILFTIRMNGSVIGYIEEFEPVETLYEHLMQARRTGEIEQDCSIILNRQLAQLDLWTDASRIVSPFCVVKNCFNVKIDSTKPGDDGLSLTTTITIKPEFQKYLSSASTEINMYDEGIKSGFFELMDPDMTIQNAVIAGSLKDFYEKPLIYTHIALPNHLHGIIAGMVPAVNLNAGVRASYLTNHVKQAIGPTNRYPQLKYAAIDHVLVAPQAPLVRPCTYNFTHMPETPFGNNVIVAFMQFKYNQEDGIILNRASVEAGLLKIDSITTKSNIIERNIGEFKIPPPGTNLNGNVDSYNKIDPATALPAKVGEVFYEGDALICKIIKGEKGISDTSTLNDQPDGKYPVSANPRPLRFVAKNKIHNNNKTEKYAVFGQYRVPIVGDKFNSEHAQKGTCQRIMNPEDLPYSSNGVRPDVIFNPPAIFKRKTYGHVYLPTIAKIAALLGCPIDCTPYSTVRSDEEICALLQKLGLNDAGCETMYDPNTGRPYKCKIFFANHYWERQSHLVENKINVRDGGSKDTVMFQPKKGKKNNGGQSFDRMAFDANIASGICELMRETHLNRGSKIKIGLCNRCHNTMGYLHAGYNQWVCPRCGAHPDITVREVPPAANLITHILNGLYIAVDYFDHIDSGSN